MHWVAFLGWSANKLLRRGQLKDNECLFIQVIYFSLAVSSEKNRPPMTVISFLYADYWYKVWRKAARKSQMYRAMFHFERWKNYHYHYASVWFHKEEEEENISVVKPALCSANGKPAPADTVGLMPFLRFGLLHLCTLSSQWDRSILYALNLVALHRDVLQSALLQSQGCHRWLINWGNAWSDLFTKHT